MTVTVVPFCRLAFSKRRWPAVVAEIARFARRAVEVPVWIAILVAVLVAVRAVVAVETAMLATIIVAVAAIIAIEPIAVAILARLIVVLPVIVAVVVPLRTIVIALLRLELALRHSFARATLAAELPATLATQLRLAIAFADLRLRAVAAILVLVVKLFTVMRILRIERLRARQTGLVFAALAHLLLAIGQNDAVVVLGVLQVIFSQHAVTGRQRIAGERYIFLSYVRRRSAHLNVGPGALKTAGQRVLRFAVVVIATVIIVIVVAAATATILLSLPHGLPFTLLWF